MIREVGFNSYFFTNVLTLPCTHVLTLCPVCRCSIQRECSGGLMVRSWIGMGEGPQQCPSMTLTPQEISLSADVKVPDIT